MHMFGTKLPFHHAHLKNQTKLYMYIHNDLLTYITLTLIYYQRLQASARRELNIKVVCGGSKMIMSIRKSSSALEGGAD